MNKKILALALAIVFIATAFTACKNNFEMMKINGKEYPVAFDKEGNTIINDKNQIAILVTDSNQEVVKYENGEDQTYWVQLYSDLVVDGAVHSKDYKLGIPNGWTGSEMGRVIKDGTDDRCYIKFEKVLELTDEATLETYLEALKEQNDAVASIYEKQGGTVEISESTATVTGDSLNCNILTFKITDNNGKVVHYAEQYYFVANNTIYRISYTCENGVGYDETFSFAQYIAENFTFKGEEK